MARNENTNTTGGAWTDQEKNDVWKKGKVITGYSSDTWRTDKCGKTMKWDDHGDRDSNYGWEIDHIDPVSNDGSDDIINLQPLHWENNLNKGNQTDWSCPS
ncbi:HNH endonuclease signature motif containing protein [Aquimarina sp. 2304DJ70-9]|uniref:HNH endonuclease signature motif containing protein n=1 Tax=Aquimarina penaris TaxID=3231044 RepID=UPI0034627330